MQKLFFSAIFIGIILLHRTGWAQADQICQQAFKIVKTADKYHYNPRPLDDMFSKQVFDAFIKILDEDGLLFTKEELEALKTSQYTIDEEIRNRRCSFLEKSTQLYTRKLLFADSLLHTFQSEIFTFDQKDTLIISKDSIYVSEARLEERWRQQVKLQILMSHLSASGSVNVNLSETAQVPQQAVLTSKICQIQARLNHPDGVETDVGNAFLKAISLAYDPHTLYFTLSEENEFNTLLSRQTMDFGLQLSQNNWGEIVVEAIVPGSPAWNVHVLHQGDVILEVQTPTGEVQDFACTNLGEAVSFLARETLQEASFRVRKRSGEEVRVSLYKKIVDVTDNLIQSFILEQDHKVGYIYLPSFYTNEDSTSRYLPNGCANDVAKDLIRLKNEGIKGLIIDLRNNGGGSMLEAVRLAGMFIDYGPIAITESRQQIASTLKDMNRGAVYTGPVVILINTWSASASELFAATLQDYNRAVIIGSNSFGKATSQQIVPLEGDLSHTPTAFLKVTVSKFYRVTGKSHQKTGIIPDIRLSTVYDYLEVGEQMYPTALASTQVDKKTYYSPNTFLPLADLRLRSEQRLKSDSTFALIEAVGQKLSKIQKHYSIPLDYPSFKTYYANGLYTSPEPSEIQAWVVRNPSYLEGISSMTDPEKEINEQAMTNIKKDVYIYEAYAVITDLIDLLKN